MPLTLVVGGGHIPEYPIAFGVPATVPEQYLSPPSTNKRCKKNVKKNYQKSQQIIKNHPKSSKIEVRGGPGGSWGRSWRHFGLQGCPRGARSRKNDQNSVRTPFVRPFWGTQKWQLFHFMLIFWVFFCRCFLKALFEGLRTPF